jgi:hypothetical protein
MASAKIVEKYGPEVPMSPTSFVMFNGDTRLATRIHREEPDLAVRQPAVFVTGSWLTEVPARKISDIMAAVDAVSTLSPPQEGE